MVKGHTGLVSRRSLGGRSLFGFGRQLFPFEIASPAFSFFGFVELFAHTSVFTSAKYSDFVWHYESLGATIQHLFGAGRDAGGGDGITLWL
jgi:hypothetical protein